MEVFKYLILIFILFCVLIQILYPIIKIFLRDEPQRQLPVQHAKKVSLLDIVESNHCYHISFYDYYLLLRCINLSYGQNNAQLNYDIKIPINLAILHKLLSRFPKQFKKEGPKDPNIPDNNITGEELKPILIFILSISEIREMSHVKDISSRYHFCNLANGEFVPEVKSTEVFFSTVSRIDTYEEFCRKLVYLDKPWQQRRLIEDAITHRWVSMEFWEFM